MRTLTCVLGLIGLTGCGEAVSTDDADAGMDSAVAEDSGAEDRDSGGSEDDAGATQDGGEPGADAGAVDAGVTVDAGESDGGTPCSFVETLTRGCSTDENCVVGVHQTDCCGNTHAYGMNHSERDRFDDAEAECRDTYPDCECASGPTRTDNDETTSDPSEVQVACVSRGPGRVCVTYVDTRPLDGR